jgi:hypothetical protein
LALALPTASRANDNPCRGTVYQRKAQGTLNQLNRASSILRSITATLRQLNAEDEVNSAPDPTISTITLRLREGRIEGLRAKSYLKQQAEIIRHIGRLESVYAEALTLRERFWKKFRATTSQMPPEMFRAAFMLAEMDDGNLMVEAVQALDLGMQLWEAACPAPFANSQDA